MKRDPLIGELGTVEFGAWLAFQAGRDDPVGDLARDTTLDPDFPRQGTEESGAFIRRCEAYLGCAPRPAFAALERAIEEFRSLSTLLRVLRRGDAGDVDISARYPGRAGQIYFRRLHSATMDSLRPEARYPGGHG